MTAALVTPSPWLSPVAMISLLLGNLRHHSQASSISALVGLVGVARSRSAYDGMTKQPGLDGGLSGIAYHCSTSGARFAPSCQAIQAMVRDLAQLQAPVPRRGDIAFRST